MSYIHCIKKVIYIKINRLRWAGHVIRLEEQSPARRVLVAIVEGRRQRGRPKLRWEDGVMDDARKLGERNWRNAARNRDRWRKILKKALAQNGLLCQWWWRWWWWIRNKNIINCIKTQRRGWFSHVHRITDDRLLKKLYEWKPTSLTLAGRPKIRWENVIKENLRIMKMNNWTKRIQGRDKLKGVF